MQAGSVSGISAMQLESRATMSRKMGILVVLLVLACVVSLPIGSISKTVFAPGDVFSAFGMLVKVVGDFLSDGTRYTSAQIIEMCPAYYEIWGRVRIVGVTAVCGGMLALSGSLYQMVFRNPIAAPTMLGVGNGVTLGVVVLVFFYDTAAPYLLGMKFALCYGFALVILGAVLAISLLIGKGKLLVTDMLLIGTIFSGVLGQMVMFFSYSIFTDNQWAIFNSLNEVLDISTEPLALGLLGIAFIVGAVPVIALRFKLNVVAFDPEEMRLSGTNPTLLRGVALISATILVISAQVHIGTVSMVSLAVPFLSRLVFGAEFSKQTWGNLVLGALIVVVCNDCLELIDIALFAHGIILDLPLSLIANLVTLPLFAWVMASTKRGWQ